jgi:lactam utilization protein B
MTNQQTRQIEMIKKHAAAGNKSSAARQLSAMIRAHINPIAERAALMALAVELGLHSHPDFRR